MRFTKTMINSLYLQLIIATVLLILASPKSLHPHLHCRDPDLGNGHDQMSQRKFLLVTGNGGGMGNYLIFFPAAFYFAAITGRVSKYSIISRN